MSPRAAAAFALAVLAGCTASPPVPPPEAPVQPVASAPPGADAPPAPREFRGAWVASVANIDWPSRPGLPVARQQEEIRRIVARAAELRINALVVQVRPAADALYASALEPWSEYLTGEQGKPPQPFYDPLEFWIGEARRHGIELHAWFNPYRARHSTAKSAPARSHVSVAAPRIAKTYGGMLWMDPGEPEAFRRTLAAVLDVVRRYDVDGIHIDDYFYPYPARAPGADADSEFPDDPAWQAYRLAGGRLGRADWRRRNVDTLVEALHAGIRREKPWVRFGISPFGLGRPDRRPPGVSGFSQYDRLYADVERWVAQGWLDYLAPQLYWTIDAPAQPFGALLDYWRRDNPHGRHVWPGLFTSRIDATPDSWPASEIVAQIALARAGDSAGGHLHFSMAALLENRRGIAERLRTVEYAQPALVPATTWLGGAVPPPPQVSLRPGASGGLALSVNAGEAPLVAVWARYARGWVFSTHPASRGGAQIPADASGRAPEVLVVSAVSRLGLESPRVRIDTASARSAGNP